MIPFKHPTTVLLAGPTGCGKTQLLIRMLRERMIRPAPERIVWVYSEWQNAYDVLAADQNIPKVEFVKGFTDDLYETFDSRHRNVLVLDDQMENAAAHRKGSTITKYFTQGSHHRNLTVIYIVQNLFSQAKSTRTISLNSHYLVLFKNPRDKTQIRTLAIQMYPKNFEFLVDTFEDATSEPYGYVHLDLHPQTPDILRVRSDIFNKSSPLIYVPIQRLAKKRTAASSGESEMA
jgi:hypothetical protein